MKRTLWQRFFDPRPTHELVAEAHFRDHEHLMHMAGLAVRGGDIDGAHAELDRAHEAYQRYLRSLNGGERTYTATAMKNYLDYLEGRITLEEYRKTGEARDE